MNYEEWREYRGFPTVHAPPNLRAHFLEVPRFGGATEPRRLKYIMELGASGYSVRAESNAIPWDSNLETLARAAMECSYQLYHEAMNVSRIRQTREMTERTYSRAQASVDPEYGMHWRSGPFSVSDLMWANPPTAKAATKPAAPARELHEDEGG